MPIFLEIKNPTTLKLSPEQSSTLPADQVYRITEGSDLLKRKLELAAAIENIDGTGHIKFTLKDSALGGRNTWWVYGRHAEVTEKVPRKPEQEKTISFNVEFKEPDRGRKIIIPGYPNGIYLNDPIGKAESFKWYEALHGGDRIPEGENITWNIVRLAESLQEFRDKLDKPFKITSWYRPPAINRRVGGASQSRHLLGDAIDFYIDGIGTQERFKLFSDLWGHLGGVGKYRNNSITHLDARGYKSRWYN